MYPLEIPGIDGPSMESFTFDEKADEQTMRRLVGEIPAEMEVSFFDEGYPSPSDPGAYVTFRRYNAEYIMRRGNHGWSTDWQPVTAEHLVGYLSTCSKYNRGPGFPNAMFAHPAAKTPLVREPETSSVEQKKWWQFWK
jgi:hypothetical protein